MFAIYHCGMAPFLQMAHGRYIGAEESKYVCVCPRFSYLESSAFLLC